MSESWEQPVSQCTAAEGKYIGQGNSGKEGMDSKKNAQNYYHKQVNGFALTFGHKNEEGGDDDDVY